MSALRLQRVGPFATLPEFVGSKGVKAEDILGDTGLTAEMIADPEALIPFGAACKLIERASRLTGIDPIGLEFGRINDHSTLGIVGELAAQAPTLGEALMDFVRNQHRNWRGAAVFLLPVADGLHLGYGIYDRHEPGADQIHDAVVAIAVNSVRRLAGPRAGPREVMISHRGNAPRQHYEALLGCPVRFNQPYTAIALSAEAMKLAIPGADPALRRKLAAEVEAEVTIGPLDFAAHVRHILMPNILIGEASSERIARQIGVHVRTLNRRLSDEGTSFRVIEQELRYTVACELLSLTTLDVAEISATLAYSTTSAFDRAFRRWAGVSPTAWRAARQRERLMEG